VIIPEVLHLAIIEEKIISLLPGKEFGDDPAEELGTELLGDCPGQAHEIGHGLDTLFGYRHQVPAAPWPDHHLAGLDKYPGPESVFHRPCGHVADGFEFL